MTKDGLAGEQDRGVASTRDTLLVISIRVRAFLLPHWRRWHEVWGPPAPTSLSQWTCVRSSSLLVQALERRGIDAKLRSGRPIDNVTPCLPSDCGLHTASGWVSHTWVQAADHVVDITADQFGYDPVIVTPVDDPAYRPAIDIAQQLQMTPAGTAAVNEIWSDWCRLDQQERGNRPAT